MNKITFVGDGKTKDFNFTFPFFMKSDVVVEINSTPATNYGMFCVLNGINSDIPFSGGRIHFAQAPKATDTITIYRKLKVSRIADYQATSPYNPTILNQDLNYMVEVLKDMKTELNDFSTKYDDIVNKESTLTLLERIDAISEQISDTMDAIEGLGDITTVQTNISNLATSISNLSESMSTLSSTVGNHTNSLDTLNTLKNEVIDYVVETQNPTSANNYTWYRKYKSGWIEQGGRATTNSGNPKQVILPVEMADTYYNINMLGQTSTDGYSNAQWQVMSVTTATSPKSTKSFYAQPSITGYNLFFYWEVKGMVAEQS